MSQATLSAERRYSAVMVLGYLGFDLQSLKITMSLLDCNPIINQRTPVYMLNHPMGMQSIKEVLNPAAVVVVPIIDVCK